MRINLIKLALPALCIFATSVAWGQSGLSSSGGVASGNGGVVTYSMGLVSYTSVSNNGITISQGLQHAYQVVALTNTSNLDNEFSLNVFPNPTAHSVNIASTNFVSKSLVIDIYSESGQKLLSKTIDNQNTEVILANFSNGVYLLVISDNQKPLQSFKIIKNS